MDGGETFSALKRVTPKIKVLLASGYSMEDGRVHKIFGEGAGGFIHKPFKPTSLSRKIRKVLDSP